MSARAEEATRVAGRGSAKVSRHGVTQLAIAGERIVYLWDIDDFVRGGFQVSGDSVLYLADQDEDETVELYLRQLGRAIRVR